MLLGQPNKESSAHLQLQQDQLPLDIIVQSYSRIVCWYCYLWFVIVCRILGVL